MWSWLKISPVLHSWVRLSKQPSNLSDLFLIMAKERIIGSQICLLFLTHDIVFYFILVIFVINKCIWINICYTFYFSLHSQMYIIHNACNNIWGHFKTAALQFGHWAVAAWVCLGFLCGLPMVFHTFSIMSSVFGALSENMPKCGTVGNCVETCTKNAVCSAAV